MHKFKMPLMSIQIGRNIVLIFAFLLFAAILCEKGGIPYNYKIQIHNTTKNRLIFNYRYRSFDDINPQDTLIIMSNEFRDFRDYDILGSGISGAAFDSEAREQDPIKQLLQDFGFFEVRIYRNDSLKVTWEQEDNLPVTIHNFYNYNSWEVELTPDVPDQTGTLNFYIEEADLE